MTSDEQPRQPDLIRDEIHRSLLDEETSGFEDAYRFLYNKARSELNAVFDYLIVCVVFPFVGILRESALRKRRTKQNNTEKQRLGRSLLLFQRSRSPLMIQCDE